PRVDEPQPARRHDLGADLLQRAPHSLLVVDDEPEVAIVVAALRARCAQREELVAQFDERHVGPSAAAELEGEDSPVPLKRLVDVADLQRDVVDANEPGRHGDAAYVLGGPIVMVGKAVAGLTRRLLAPSWAHPLRAG